MVEVSSCSRLYDARCNFHTIRCQPQTKGRYDTLSGCQSITLISESVKRSTTDQSRLRYCHFSVVTIQKLLSNVFALKFIRKNCAIRIENCTRDSNQRHCEIPLRPTDLVVACRHRHSVELRTLAPQAAQAARSGAARRRQQRSSARCAGFCDGKRRHVLPHRRFQRLESV